MSLVFSILSGVVTMGDEKKKGLFKAAFDSTVDKIKNVNNLVLFILMVGMALVLGANITMRYLFNHPLPWSNTISRYAYIYIVLLGTAVSYMEGSHAKIEFIYDAVPKRFKIVFDFFHYIVMMFLSLVLIIVGIKHTITMWYVSPPVIPWLSVGVVYLSVPICAIAIFVFLIQKMLEIKT